MVNSALVLQSPAVVNRVSDMQSRAPMPNWATAYVDFSVGLQITGTELEDSPASNLGISGATGGHYYDSDEVGIAAANGGIRRIEYDVDGYPIGLRASGGWSSFLAPEARTNLSVGVKLGLDVTPDGSPAFPWQQWYKLTPNSEGEASLSLPVTSVTTAYAWWSIDVLGAGVVQLGKKSGTDNVFANFDLATGEAWGIDGMLPAMKQRADGSWTLVAKLPVQGTPNANLQPYVAAVADITSPRLGAGGLPFSARLPRLTTAATTSIAPPEPHTNEGSANRSSDDIYIPRTLLPVASAFSLLLKLRADWFPHRWGQGVFAMGFASGTIHLRFNEGGCFRFLTGHLP